MYVSHGIKDVSCYENVNLRLSCPRRDRIALPVSFSGAGAGGSGAELLLLLLSFVSRSARAEISCSTIRRIAASSAFLF